MNTDQTAAPRHASFAEFYPFYLSEHSDRTCRRMHFVGSTLSLMCLAMLAVTGKPSTFYMPCCAAMVAPGSDILCSRKTSPPASSARSTASWATG